ncbi:MAG: aldo/keto reductase [Anaerolineaceae bacterium]|nr:aldo/keto reductase [Anaerolineaceae bacterium]
MKYRRLGKTEMQVSVVGIGAWQFGGEWGREYTVPEVKAILERGQQEGINLIDTAECYGDHTSERLIGESLPGKREDWIIASKFGHEFHKNFSRTDRFDPTSVQHQLEKSLKSLKTDYIDLYQFHSGPDSVFDNQELWTMLDKQKQAGKIRHLGISIGSNTNIHQTRSAPDVGASAIQVVYNRLDRAPEEEVFPACQELDLGVLARVPLASGFLSGKYKPGDTFDNPNDVRSLRDAEKTKAALQEVQRVRDEEVPEGVDMASWALAWCLRHPAVTTVIPGCKNPDQVSSNANAVNLI